MLNSPDTSPARGVIARLPVSTIQRQFWFLDQLSPGDPSLNVPMHWELFGQVQAEVLERAFRHVIARHEILRSRFADQDGDLVQEIMDHADFRLSVIDLRTTPEAERPARLLEIQKRESAVPFDLAQTGLIRAVIVRMAADHVSLLVCAHHAVFDGFSIALMAHEVCASAATFEAGTEPDLPELLLQYGDYALWQQEILASGVLEEERPVGPRR